MIRAAGKERLHPRNRFRAGYDFGKLVRQSPALAAFVKPNPHGDESVDYADPRAVKALNQALLEQAYGLQGWDLPPGYLCPPVPGRSDYLHYLADLLAGTKRDALPRGRSVAVLDIGVGANCIYPLIGASEYGWRFVGSETDPVALAWAVSLVARNPGLASLIEGRLQPSATDCFRGVVRPGEFFDLSMCNPPFYASAAEAAAANLRKRRNLGSKTSRASLRNFGGRNAELWCPGGELGFVQRMIAQSIEFAYQCRWFTTLVSKSVHLPRLREALRDADAADLTTIDMAQGQKQSRILAWTFMGPDQGGPPAKASTRPG